MRENIVEGQILTEGDIKEALKEQEERRGKPLPQAEAAIDSGGVLKEQPLVESEQRREDYEREIAIRDVMGWLKWIIGIPGGIFLVKFFSKDFYDFGFQQKRIEDLGVGYVYTFDREKGEGGWQIVNALKGVSEVDGIDLNDRNTLGFIFVGRELDGRLEGGNIAGERIREIFTFSERMGTADGREKLLKEAKNQGRGVEELREFIDEVGKKDLSWEELKGILPKYGFNESVLEVITETRDVYLTGRGSLKEALTEARKISENLLLKDEQLALKVAEKTGADLELAQKVAAAFPAGTGMDDYQEAMTQMVAIKGEPIYYGLDVPYAPQTADLWGIMISGALLCGQALPPVRKWGRRMAERLIRGNR